MACQDASAPKVLNGRVNLNYVKVFLDKNFLECLHVDAISFLRLSDDISGLQIIKYFSQRQRVHFLLTFKYDLNFFYFPPPNLIVDFPFF